MTTTDPTTAAGHGPAAPSSEGHSPAALDNPIATAIARVFDPAFKHDPYSSYAVLREAAPFIPGPFGLQLVPRYAEIDAIMQDPSWSHAEEAKLLHPDSDGSDLPASFLWMEPPDHTRLRRLVSKAFTARRVDGLRERVTEVFDNLLDDVIDAGEIDWVERIAYPLPLTMITEMLGVPPEAHDLVRSMSYGIARGLDPDIMLTPQELQNRATSAKAFKDYFGGLVAERKADPKDDLISDLARVEAEGERLTTDEMLSTLVVLVVAGHETTVNLIANGLLSLMRNPDQYAALCANPDLAGPAIDELMRYDGPSHFTTREATRPVEVSGHHFEAGQGVIILLASGNRDARAYPEADRLDLTRYAGRAAVPRHLGFGVGHHYCIGAPLVKIEMEVVLRTLATRRPELELLADPPPYRPNLVVRGLHALPVRLHGGVRRSESSSD